MNLADLMSGIGVVIDDAFENAAAIRDDNSGDADPIFRIVRQIEREWSLPFYTASRMPSDETWPGLLQVASFILLDWRWAHSRFPGHALTPTGVMAIRCKQFHLPDL